MIVVPHDVSHPAGGSSIAQALGKLAVGSDAAMGNLCQQFPERFLQVRWITQEFQIHSDFYERDAGLNGRILYFG